MTGGTGKLLWFCYCGQHNLTEKGTCSACGAKRVFRQKAHKRRFQY